MTRNLLFEIGVEELPARFIEPALESIEIFTKNKLESLEISYEEIKVAGTCRRLALFIKNLSEKQRDKEEEILGPALNVGLDKEGNYTPALLGFVKKQELDPKELFVKETPKGKYFCAKKIITGRKTIELLPHLLLELLQNIFFPKKMRWGDFDFSFGRPIRWILALYGNEIVPITVAGVRSNLYTKGHVFLSKGEIRLEKADWELYKETLFKNFVILEVEERKHYTRLKIEEIAKDYGQVVIEEHLLNENSHLVEFPFPIIGKFSEKFLNLPEKLIITALQEHQRYFYLVDKNKKLLPYFVAVNNNKPKNEALVIKGHEKVAKARLEDALFYYERDLKEPLKNRIEKLKGVVYHIKAGTLYEKTLRLIELCKYLKKELFSDLSDELIERTAYYAKADLATEVVKEFPSLQGYIGAHYLSLEGERELTTAIYEQYLPSPKEEAFPETKLGIILSLADKIDHLSTLIGAGEKISGEGDPYALRRAAYGIIKILLSKELLLELENTFSYALELVQKQGYLKNREAFKEILEFVRKRLEGEFLSQGYPKNFIYVVLEQPLNPYQQYLKLLALREIYQQRDFQDLLILFKRVTQILKNLDFKTLKEINPELLGEEAEILIYQKLIEISPKLQALAEENKFLAYLETLMLFKPLIDKFFEQVFVMVEEEKLRLNRLSLLYNLAQYFYKFGDLSYLA